MKKKLGKKIAVFSIVTALVVAMLPILAFAGENDVAQIGEDKYTTLAAAVGAAEDGATITLLKDCNGDGIAINASKNINLTIDFGGYTYTVNGNLVGSSSTVNQAFHFEKGNTITLKNGKIVVDNESAKILIQNYSKLTLVDIAINATEKCAGLQYGLSNNCGEVNIIGNTSITLLTNLVALDVSYWPSFYPDGTQVNINTTGTITGKIEIGLYGDGSKLAESNKSILTIKNVNHVGSITTANSETGKYGTGLNEEAAKEFIKGNVGISGGVFSEKPNEEYLAEGFVIKKLADGTYGVVDPSVPETADSNNWILWAILGLLALGAAVIVVARKKEY